MKKKTISKMFRDSKPHTPGRRLTRWLDDAAVKRALKKNEDINHRMKFMSPGQKLATALSLAS